MNYPRAKEHYSFRFRKNYSLITIVIFSLALRLLWLRSIITHDEGFLGYHAMLWLHGYLPYAYSTATQGPSTYLLYLLPISLFGNNIIPVRILNDILFLISLITLYLLVQNWYSKRAGLISALFYGIFMNMPVFEAQTAISESFSVPFIIFSLYFCNKFLMYNERKYLVISGILISLASTIRITQAIGIILLVFILFSNRYKSDRMKGFFAKKFAADISLLMAGVSVPISLVVAYFWSQGALDDLIQFMFLRRFYVASVVPNVPIGMMFLIIAEGLPLWLLSILGLITCVWRHQKYDKFLLAWFMLFMIAASVPPNFGHHYAQIIAPASVLAGASLSLVMNCIMIRKSQESRNQYEFNLLGIFVISILFLSFLPSIYFQSQQYPNFRINQWNFINWEYGGAWGPWTYNDQLDLANFLKNNTSEDDQILVHARWATPYWLSGHRAPSKYVTTVIDPNMPKIVTIPENEFQRILQKVEKGDFKFIVIVSRDQQTDPIVNATLSKYFYVKSICTAQIFSKYNSEGEYISYDFIYEFSDAKIFYETQNGTMAYFSKDDISLPEIYRLEINDEQRDTIRQPSKVSRSILSFENIFIPPNSRLSFGIGIEPWVWERNGGDGAEFEIYIKYKGETVRLFSKFLNPKQKIEERKWHDYSIDLSNYGNRIVSIMFVNSPGPKDDISDDWSNWAEPRILTKIEDEASNKVCGVEHYMIV